jgi:hypothetical protein
MKPKTALLTILGAAFVSFAPSVSFWFGVFGEPDRDLGLFVGSGCPRSSTSARS